MTSSWRCARSCRAHGSPARAEFAHITLAVRAMTNQRTIRSA